MSKRIWSAERILEEIRRLHASGSEITQSRVETIDSRLTSAAVRYFGSWRAAVVSAGIDYRGVAETGRKRRSEKMTKWSKDSILQQIRDLNLRGEDLSSSVVRRKHLALYATARRPEHFGSWSQAVTAAGIDYGQVRLGSQERRREAGDWKRRLLADWEAGAPDPAVSSGAGGHDASGPATAPPAWARELLHEKLMEIYDSTVDPGADVPEGLRSLLDPDGAAE